MPLKGFFNRRGVRAKQYVEVLEGMKRPVVESYVHDDNSAEGEAYFAPRQQFFASWSVGRVVEVNAHSVKIEKRDGTPFTAKLDSTTWRQIPSNKRAQARAKRAFGPQRSRGYGYGYGYHYGGGGETSGERAAWDSFLAGPRLPKAQLRYERPRSQATICKEDEADNTSMGGHWVFKGRQYVDKDLLVQATVQDRTEARKSALIGSITAVLREQTIDQHGLVVDARGWMGLGVQFAEVLEPVEGDDLESLGEWLVENSVEVSSVCSWNSAFEGDEYDQYAEAYEGKGKGERSAQAYTAPTAPKERHDFYQDLLPEEAELRLEAGYVCSVMDEDTGVLETFVGPMHKRMGPSMVLVEGPRLAGSLASRPPEFF